MQKETTLRSLSTASNTKINKPAIILRGIESASFIKRPAPIKIAHVGTYPPCKCGIATYTQDVVSAIHSRPNAASPVVVAMATQSDDIRYGWPVRHIIVKDRPADYPSVARTLRSEGTNLISLQHEHGIYGGDAGEWVMNFINALEGRIPVVTTLHTVVPDPTDSMRRTIREIVKASKQVLVLNSRAIPILEDAYGVPTGNVIAIPHGTPSFDQSRRPSTRTRVGVEGQTVLSTFGLISPGKGLEHAIEAVALNKARHPDLHYYILGATHPGIVRHSGESYREGLVKLTQDLGVEDRVHFVNRYLSLDELTDWLLATDIYVTPYLNSNQIVSGTLSYAVAAGRPVLSTPYIHAIELLDGKAGLLTPFNDPQAMGENLDLLLSNTVLRESMAVHARKHGSASAWPQIGKRYSEIFSQAVDSYDTSVISGGAHSHGQ